MKQRTLTETLMGEEAIGEYQTTLYDKTATAYMFGYANSGFGSGMGGGFKGGSSFGSAGNFGIGRAPNSLKEKVCDFEFQYRAGKHELFGNDHINIDIISPIDSSILQKIHIDWKK